jgi:protein TonB
MFEQSILTGQNTNKTWTMAVSLAVQVSLIAVGIMIPLLYTDSIPGLAKWVTGVIAPPPAAVPPPPDVQQQAAVRQTVRENRVFTAPLKPPPTVDMTPDPARTPTLFDPSLAVISSGPPSGGPNPIGDVIRSHPVAAPKPPDPPPVHTTTHTSAPLHVSSGVQEAKLINKVIPIYPRIAISAGVQGTVHLIGVIGRDGAIRELRAVDGPVLLVRAARDAVRQWTYKPTLLSGEPVEVIAPIEVVFTLNR